MAKPQVARQVLANYSMQKVGVGVKESRVHMVTRPNWSRVLIGQAPQDSHHRITYLWLKHISQVARSVNLRI